MLPGLGVLNALPGINFMLPGLGVLNAESILTAMADSVLFGVIPRAGATFA